MNLMFRKNFREQKSSSGKSGGSKVGASRNANKRSSRETGYGPIEEHHYRTHLFFNPPSRGTFCPGDEGRFQDETFHLTYNTLYCICDTLIILDIIYRIL